VTLPKLNRKKIISISVLLILVSFGLFNLFKSSSPSCIADGYAPQPEIIEVSTPLMFNQTRIGATCGWSSSEYWGTWSDGTVASLELLTPSTFQKSLSFQLVARPFLEGTHDNLKVNLFANGKFMETLNYNKGEYVQTKKFTVTNLAAQSGLPVLRLTFEFVEPATPASLGVNGDSRLLGLGVESLTLLSGS
jgi:hypothetical protein